MRTEEPECVFIALCDGAFYQGIDGIMGKTKMDGLRDIAANAKYKNVFAMPACELPMFLIKYNETTWERRSRRLSAIIPKNGHAAPKKRLPKPN